MISSDPISYKRKDIDEDIDILLELDRALQMEPSDGENEDENLNKSYLAEEFPKSFVFGSNSQYQKQEPSMNLSESQLQQIYLTLMKKQEYLKKKQDEIEREQKIFMKEKKKFLKEKEDFENEMRFRSVGKNKKVSSYDDYCTLEKKYNSEKMQWKEERDSLIHQIELLKLTNNIVESEPLEDEHVEIDITPKKKRTKLKKLKSQKSIEVIPHFAQPSKSIESPRATKVAPKPQPVKVPSSNPAQSNPDKIPNVFFSSQKRNHPKTINIDEKYLNFGFKPGIPIHEEIKPDGRKIVRYRGGTVSTVFRNGTEKLRNGKASYIFYSNGDISIDFGDGVGGYKYKESQAIELKFPSKSRIYVFPNGQREYYLPNGDIHIQYPTGQFQITHENGDYELYLPNGKVEKKISQQT